VTEDQTQTPNAGGPQEVAHRDYAALVDSLTGTLDLHGGLAEAVDVAGYTAMSNHIAHLLNLEAGLRSALAAHHGTGQPRELGAATSIAELLPRAGAGDPAAWDEIMRRYGSVMLATVRSFSLQTADADDVVQNTWMRLAENCHRIQRPERLGEWLTTTASRECLRIIRHQAQHPPLAPHDTTEAAAGQGDSSVDPEQRVIDADIARTLEKLVEELSPSRRTLVRELFFSDTPRPYAEVTRAAGIPPGGIGPTRARALRQLRERLAERGLTAATTARKTSESDSPSVPRGHREALLDGARRCLLERGYAGTTARDLVAASGTNLASIGYHFGSKEALLTEAMQQCFDEYNEQIAQIAQIAFADPSATPLQQVWASWETLVNTFDQYRPLMVVFVEALAQAERVPELQAQLAECYERLRTTVADMVHASADGLSDASARQVASFLIATYNGLHVQWLLDPERAPTPTPATRSDSADTPH
jgi:RNA polymerase sigma factor (sigma-70 family)